MPAPFPDRPARTVNEAVDGALERFRVLCLEAGVEPLHAYACLRQRTEYLHEQARRVEDIDRLSFEAIARL